MESTATIQEGEPHATLQQHQQREIGLALQATPVELADLALLGRQLHWSVVRRSFRPLHLQLDELVTTWHELADPDAERAMELGYWSDGQAGTVAESTELEPVLRGALADREVVQLLTSRLSRSSGVRGRAAVAPRRSTAVAVHLEAEHLHGQMLSIAEERSNTVTSLWRDGYIEGPELRRECVESSWTGNLCR